MARHVGSSEPGSMVVLPSLLRPEWPLSPVDVARFLGVSGLDGLLAPDDPAVSAGLHEQDGRWRLTLDPGAFAIGAPDMERLVAQPPAPVTLARGELDPMNTDEQLAALGTPTITLPGLGHNAHVQNPERTITLLDQFP